MDDSSNQFYSWRGGWYSQFKSLQFLTDFSSSSSASVAFSPIIIQGSTTFLNKYGSRKSIVFLACMYCFQHFLLACAVFNMFFPLWLYLIYLWVVHLFKCIFYHQFFPNLPFILIPPFLSIFVIITFFRGSVDFPNIPTDIIFITDETISLSMNRGRWLNLEQFLEISKYITPCSKRMVFLFSELWKLSASDRSRDYDVTFFCRCVSISWS